MRSDVTVRTKGLEDVGRLRRVLLELGVDDVREARHGLDVTLRTSPDALRGVAGTLGAWVADGAPPITLKLDGESLLLTGMLDDDQRRAVDRWISRRA
jgi:hypothetical protein